MADDHTLLLALMAKGYAATWMPSKRDPKKYELAVYRPAKTGLVSMDLVEALQPDAPQMMRLCGISWGYDLGECLGGWPIENPTGDPSKEMFAADDPRMDDEEE